MLPLYAGNFYKSADPESSHKHCWLGFAGNLVPGTFFASNPEDAEGPCRSSGPYSGINRTDELPSSVLVEAGTGQEFSRSQRPQWFFSTFRKTAKESSMKLQSTPTLSTVVFLPFTKIISRPSEEV